MSRSKKRHRLITGMTAGLLSVSMLSVFPVNAFCDEAGVKNGLFVEDGIIRYYQNGQPVKNTWKKIKDRRYYFRSNGSAATASCRIDGTWYVFDEKGRLFQPQKPTVKTVGSNVYCVTKGGKAVSGWQIIKKNVYYARKNGACAKSEKISYIRFDRNSRAKIPEQAMAKIEAARFIRKHTKSSWGRKRKFKACFRYIMAYTAFAPSENPPRFHKKYWQYRGAVAMFQNGLVGNCYGVSSCVAAVAKELGYKPVQIRLYSDHAYVRIGKRYYDNMNGAVFASRRKPAGKAAEKFRY